MNPNLTRMEKDVLESVKSELDNVSYWIDHQDIQKVASIISNLNQVLCECQKLRRLFDKTIYKCTKCSNRRILKSTPRNTKPLYCNICESVTKHIKTGTIQEN